MPVSRLDSIVFKKSFYTYFAVLFIILTCFSAVYFSSYYKQRISRIEQTYVNDAERISTALDASMAEFIEMKENIRHSTWVKKLMTPSYTFLPEFDALSKIERQEELVRYLALNDAAGELAVLLPQKSLVVSPYGWFTTKEFETFFKGKIGIDYSKIEELAKQHTDINSIVASEIPWRGQSCFLNKRNPSNLFEYSIIRIVKTLDGNFVYDFSVMQRYIDLCKKHEISGDIELFGLVNVWIEESFDTVALCLDYPENILLRYFDVKSGGYHYLKDADEIKKYIIAIEQYFIETEQISKVRVAADEPVDIIKYRRSVEQVHKLAPMFIFKTAINHAEFIEEFNAVINDFAPFIQCASKEY